MVQDEPTANVPPAPAAKRSGSRILRTNRAFFSCLLAFHLIISGLTLWPLINEHIKDSTAADGSPIPRWGRVKPIYRTTLFRVAIVATTCGVVLYALLFRDKRHRNWRTVALLGATLCNAGLVKANHRLLVDQRMTDEKQWSNIERLKLIECQSAQIDAFSIRRDMRGKGIRNFAELHHTIMEYYAQVSPNLKKYWANAYENDEQRLKTFFIMNFVSGLWNFGNRTEVSRPGCVFSNEQNNWQVPPESLVPYLDAEIGCCTDFAYLTKSLMDHEGIENRLTEIPGHIFNEVKLASHWCIVDATVNMFVDCGWEELYEREQRRETVTVLLFPHSNLVDARSERYRSRAGHFRVITLARIANPPSHFRLTEHPDLPGHFRAGE